MRGINKILLENILPAHVAEHYLLGVQGVSGILQDSNVIMLANHGIRHTYFLPNTGSSRYLIIIIIMKPFISEPEQDRITYFQSNIHDKYNFWGYIFW